MADIFANSHQQARARAEKAAREAIDPNRPDRIKARVAEAAKAREPVKPDLRYPWPRRFYEPV